MKKIKEKQIISFIIAFILLQPFYDVFVYFLNDVFGIKSFIISLIRPSISLFIYIWILCNNKINQRDKTISFSILSVFSLYCLLHLLNVKDYFIQNSAGNIYDEIRYLTVCGYYLLMFINIYFIFKLAELKQKYDLIRAFIIALSFIVLLYFLSVITGTSLSTYPNSVVKNGWKGWSVSSHYIGHTILLGYVIVIYGCIVKKLFSKIWNFILPIWIITPAFYMVGTKAPFLGLIAISVGFTFITIVEFVINRKITNNMATYHIVITVIMLLSFQSTFAFSNLQNQIDVASNPNSKIDFIDNNNNGNEQYNLSNFSGRINKVLDEYKNKDNKAFDNRQIQYILNRELYIISPLNDKILGYGYMTMPKNTWVETDTFSIFFSMGIVAFVIIILIPFGFVGYFGSKALLKIKKMNLNKIFFGGAFLLSLFLVSAVGYTLYYAQTNFYLVFLLNICLLIFNEELKEKE